MAGNFDKLGPPDDRAEARDFLDRWTRQCADQFRVGSPLAYADRYVLDRIRTALGLPAIDTRSPSLSTALVVRRRS